MTPIIYIRGYAGSSSAVERAVESPYNGFNDGSSKVRVEADGRPGLHLFESPLIRMLKEHDYEDYFVRVESGRVVLLKTAMQESYSQASIWIFRYYDETSSEVGTSHRKRIEELAADLAKLVDFVREKTGSTMVDLVAHSMGGLVARSLVQRTWTKTAHQKIRRLFTYGTPHGGIHFRNGVGWLEKVRDLAGPNESDTFGPRRMRAFLNLPNARDEALNVLDGSSFPPERCFCVVGTNFRDYEVTSARYAVGPGSDGLVMCEHAYIKGSSRAYIHRAHSGPYGLVNSEEGYQNLQRFLFGDTAVKVSLREIRIDTGAKAMPKEKGVKLAKILIEAKVAIRGVPAILHRHSKELGSALPVSVADLKSGETIFQTFLMRGKRPQADEDWSRFRIDLRLVPVFVKDRRIFSDQSFEGEAIYKEAIQIGVSDTRDDGSREVGWAWGAFNRSADEVTRIPGEAGTHRIPLHLNGGPVTDGCLEFEIKPW